MVKILPPPFFHLALLAQAAATDLCLSSIHVIDDFLHDGEASTLLKKVQMSEPLVEASVEERLRETLDVPLTRGSRDPSSQPGAQPAMCRSTRTMLA